VATALTPIAWQSLSSTASSVTFSSIPGTYRDLYLVINASTTALAHIRFTANGDTATNYHGVNMYGDGSTAGSYATASQTAGYVTTTAHANTGAPTMATMNILDYSATDKHKTFMHRTSKAALGADANVWRWASTAAITTLNFYPSAGSFEAGSTFALYGIAA
jgi:hypothetical protein